MRRPSSGPRAGPRLGVTGGVLALILVPGWFASGGFSLPFLVNAGGLLLGYGLPAWWIGSAGDVIRRWRFLLGIVLVATLIWDGATALLELRPFLSEWWLVYSSGPLVTFGLFVLHGLAVKKIGASLVKEGKGDPRGGTT